MVCLQSQMSVGKYPSRPQGSLAAPAPGRSPFELIGMDIIWPLERFDLC